MSSELRRVLVTGGAGFIGSHIVDQLVASGRSVVVLDDLSSGCKENLERSWGAIEFIEGSVLDADTLTACAREVDAVCHQAAQLEITTAMADPVSDLRANTEGTLNVLQACRDNGIGRLVFASSACVYGQALEVPQTEQHPTLPNWAYGVSKLAAEQYGRLYADEFGMAVVALRYSIVYGPREWYGRALPIFLKRAARREAPVVFGDGRQVRDFVHVDDIARLNVMALEAASTGFRALNGSTGIGTTIRDLAELVAKLFHTGDPLFEDVQPGQRSTLVEQQRLRLPSELQVMHLANDQAASVLGWHPEVALAAGLREEFQWLERHQERWQQLSY